MFQRLGFYKFVMNCFFLKLKALKIKTNPYATAFREHHHTTTKGLNSSPKKSLFREDQSSSENTPAVGVVETNPLPLCPEYMADAYGEEHVCWPLDLWPDEHSLYHPALLTPPPLLHTFSEPYLREASSMLQEFYATHRQWTTCEDVEVGF